MLKCLRITELINGSHIHYICFKKIVVSAAFHIVHIVCGPNSRIEKIL